MSLGRTPWLLLSLVLACLALAAGVGLVREVVAGRPLPPLRAGAESGPRPAGDPEAAEAGARGGPVDYGVIVARNLFAVSRGEATVVVAEAVAAGDPPSTLHGVMLDGDRSRAYLDDPASNRVFGYAVGDRVGGGRLERILEDRVVIRGSQGAIEILLHDPSKAQPEASNPIAPSPAPSPGPLGPGPRAPGKASQ